MIEKSYSKNSTHAYQTLVTSIQADKQTVFHHLATTAGISQWFPQLSMKKENDEQFVQFDMGDGSFEKMSLVDYATDKHIAYEWATGQVEFHLEEVHAGTKLTLKETLPLDFKALPQDFTGWYIQMKNIKATIEMGATTKIEKAEIEEVKSQIKKNLFNKK